MPHQCTNCARVFEDGSKEMLSGCPSCGGNKFQFRPDGVDASADAMDDTPEPPERPEPAGSSAVARTVGKTAATVRNVMGSTGSNDPPIGVNETGASDVTGPSVPTGEDTAQASARSDVVAPDELPSGVATDTEHRFRPARGDGESDTTTESAGADPGDDTGETLPDSGKTGSIETEPERDRLDDETVDRPDLAQLRAELNDQFESIKVLSPGQYELNLMELYDREEYIIALQEDGRYSIQVPENFRE